ncbi:MAG: hypothetical protein EA409_03665 [Saprospirales bacterium]|jgi:hypothetical protein|nr:MAG: hypothetical protein EA409_03665 [Saprospirales bacterium]
MAKTKFKEERKLRFNEFYAIFGLIIIGSLYRIFEQFVVLSAVNWASVAIYSGIVLISLGLIYLLSSVKLLTIVSKKGIKYQLFPFQYERKKIKWEDVEEYKVVNMPGKAIWSGWNVNFHSDQHNFGFGERSGLYIKLKTGENVYLGIEREEELKESIGKLADS